ncbi:MAG: hypothetical protein J0I47_08720 [Sphingomonas sp.]|uniref:GCG_CRPN prefix-to-repeats domain-containing protein n=1 Tax=Sphingomonas sp. TaxID=28214 RepID=UPI001AD2A540|nr:hypothetical protein [Sphingomonas sp.]MBN8808303.1 hypothetical protein [Sphingomonas sp.]
MNKLLTAALVASAGIASIAAIPAQAADGCGRGYHRGPYGHCRPNMGPGPVVVREPGVNLVIGNYYPRRGYWDGRRYWWHRERWNGGWRYR